MAESSCPTEKFWRVSGYQISQGSFSFYLRKPTHIYGEDPLWYHNGFMTWDDYGYTEGRDIWKSKQGAIKVAKKRLEKAIEKEIGDHQNKMRRMLASQLELENDRSE